jgi:hypothetical protein
MIAVFASGRMDYDGTMTTYEAKYDVGISFIRALEPDEVEPKNCYVTKVMVGETETRICIYHSFRLLSNQKIITQLAD